MGVISSDVLNGYLLALHLLGGCFCGVCLYYTFGAVKEVERRQRRSEEAQGSLKVLCPWFCGCLTASELLFRLTLATVSLFMLFFVATVGYRLSYFVFCKANACVTRLVFWEVFSVAVMCGYPLMFVTHFERLRMTFDGTNQSVPLWANKVVYFEGFFASSAWLTAIATHWTLPKVSGACLALVVLTYAATVSVLVGAFYTKAMAVAKQTEDDLSQRLLLETVTRMTIVVTVSLLSTTFTLFFWVGIIAVCNDCNFFLLLSYTGTSFDCALNAFCILCTFGSAQKPYQYVFGRMHAAFVRRASLSLKHATEAQIKSVSL